MGGQIPWTKSSLNALGVKSLPWRCWRTSSLSPQSRCRELDFSVRHRQSPRRASGGRPFLAVSYGSMIDPG